MTQKAVRENLEIIEIIQESKSAKKAGIRDGYKQLLHGLENNEWDSILTFSPDRLSRNAGDLGQLVDLMDEGKVSEIRTHDQIFKNTPDEKFLLMLLCGQAKLENDYRGTNVKRGMRAVCHTGKRPGPTPLGYKLWYDPSNRKAQSKIVIDDERVHHIQKLFRLVGDNGLSTREAMRIVNNDGFITTKGNPVSIGTIIKILYDPFYTGEFEYPKSSGNWYQGNYEPIISKELYSKVQTQLAEPKVIYKDLLLGYICNKCRCSRCDVKPKYEIEKKKIRISCKNPDCRLQLSKTELLQIVAERILRSSPTKDVTKKIKNTASIMQEITEKKVTQKEALVYILKKANRDMLYRCLRNIKSPILLQ